VRGGRNYDAGETMTKAAARRSRVLVAFATLVMVGAGTLRAQQPEWTLLIRNGTIVDGTGGARYAGDVAVRGDRIVAVSRTPLDAARAARVIDAR
jgi:N-acyl-D-amino-acid deacylase